MYKETYIALQMACELRQIITDTIEKVEDAKEQLDRENRNLLGTETLEELKILGLRKLYPLPPFDGEHFDDACRRIFGDYVYSKVIEERTRP